MLKKEIIKGRDYLAKVNGKLTTVQVTNIRENSTGTVYDVTNLATGRKTTFRSAAKFRQLVKPAKPSPELVEAISNRVSPERAAQDADYIVNGAAPMDHNPRSSIPPEQQRHTESGLAQQLRAGREKQTSAPHLVVVARAGTGKTTTLVEGLKRVRGEQSNLVPSPQQAAVWESMALSSGVHTVCFVAFNKSIATELQKRVPSSCQAMTMHAMGLKAVTAAFGRVKIDSWRVQNIISEILEKDIRELKRYNPTLVNATESLVNLCKQNLADGSEEELDRLTSHYDVDLNGSREAVFQLVPKVLERCKDVNRDFTIDFSDMIWLPVALALPVFKYDLLLVDEAQDLGRCQQQLALRAGARLILCGDPKQAIYGFAGADAESMDRMTTILGEMPNGCEVLPLTVTRRCGKAIVEEAKKIVPDFEAFESNGDGRVTRDTYQGEEGQTYHKAVQDGDMLLCRVNAPLVSQCFRFLRAGRKANIQGRDIGQGLLSTIKKMKAVSVEDLLGKLEDWYMGECRKENAKRNPSDQRLIALQDRHDCLTTFCEDAVTIEDVTTRIEKVFTDTEQDGIRLSSIHKAKGLESKRVFLLEPQGATVPHPMAKSAWQREQEMNLRYVAVTRAIEELVFVS